MRSFFGGGGADDAFDDAEAFVPEHLPEPGPFLAADDVTVLTGDAHVAAHGTARECFEERGVYDATFGYNLARLNEDCRHPDAGFRYGEDGDELRAEFTPTTEFCPQSDTLTVGAFRAWNGLAERHDYDLVRVRVAPAHQRADAINDRLAALADAFVETGELPDGPDATADANDESLPF